MIPVHFNFYIPPDLPSWTWEVATLDDWDETAAAAAIIIQTPAGETKGE